MAEEGIKNLSKHIKLEEEEEKEDRISNLQDCLLLEMLSLLPTTKDVIKTSKLSKRWKHLWPLVPNLIFIHDSWDSDYPHVLYDFYSSVDKTIAQCHHLPLKKFQLHTFYDSQFESRVNDYIRYAVKCNVQELDVSLENIRSSVTFKLDEMIFKNSCLVCLKLSFGLATCVFEPIGAISWNKLRTLCISRIKLDEGVIENILSGSPLLETFKLHYCYGFKRIDISSNSVENLVFSGYIDLEDLEGDIYAMEINAPNILTLKIEDGLYISKLLLLNVSSLVKVDLDYTNRLLDGTRPKHVETEMLKGLILSFCHVKELKIGISCSKALSCLEAKGFTFPSNMKYPDITSRLSFDSEDETSRLNFDSEDESTSRLSSDSEDESTSRLSSDSEDESTSRLSSDSEDETSRLSSDSEDES